MLYSILLSALLASLCAAASSTDGALVGTQVYYLGNEKYTFNIVSTETEFGKSTTLQELVPSSFAAGSINSFTAYNSDDRTLFVVATDYPQVSSCTFWSSSIGPDARSSVPIMSNVQIKYPVSSSPYPRNVAHLVLSRILIGPEGRLFATFTNGEVHEVDLQTGSFKQLFKLIDDETSLSEIHPSMTWGHVYDPEADVMWSVAMAAADAFLMSSSLSTHEVSPWIKMAMPQGDNSGFSPETIVNMHMTKVSDSMPTQIMVIMESLHNVGFDQVSFLDPKTGALDCKQCNMMSNLIELACDTNINGCDLWRVTAWDAANKQLFFQAHSTDPMDYGDLRLVTMGFDDNKQTGNLNWWTVVGPDLWFGLSGFQFVTFA